MESQTPPHDQDEALTSSSAADDDVPASPGGSPFKSTIRLSSPPLKSQPKPPPLPSPPASPASDASSTSDLVKSSVPQVSPPVPPRPSRLADSRSESDADEETIHVDTETTPANLNTSTPHENREMNSPAAPQPRSRQPEPVPRIQISCHPSSPPGTPNNHQLSVHVELSCASFLLRAISSHPPDDIACMATRSRTSYLTYAQLQDQAHEIAQFALCSRHLRKYTTSSDVSAVAAMVCSNIQEVPPICLGLMLAGVTVSPCSVDATVQELRHQLVDSKSPIVLTESKFLRVVHQAISGTRVKEVVVCRQSEMSSHRDLVHLQQDFGSVAVTLFEDILRSQWHSTSKRAPLPDIDSESAVAFMPYTHDLPGPASTTRGPRPCPLTHSNLVASVVQLLDVNAIIPVHLDTASQVSMLAVVPFFQVSGFVTVLCTALYKGAKLLLLPGWSGESVTTSVENHGIQVCPLLPSMIERLTDWWNTDRGYRVVAGCRFDQLGAIVSCSSPLHRPLEHSFVKYLCSPHGDAGRTLHVSHCFAPFEGATATHHFVSSYIRDGRACAHQFPSLQYPKQAHIEGTQQQFHRYFAYVGTPLPGVHCSTRPLPDWWCEQTRQTTNADDRFGEMLCRGPNLPSPSRANQRQSPNRGALLPSGDVTIVLPNADCFVLTSHKLNQAQTIHGVSVGCKHTEDAIKRFPSVSDALAFFVQVEQPRTTAWTWYRPMLKTIVVHDRVSDETPEKMMDELSKRIRASLKTNVSTRHIPVDDDPHETPNRGCARGVRFVRSIKQLATELHKAAPRRTGRCTKAELRWFLQRSLGGMPSVAELRTLGLNYVSSHPANAHQYHHPTEDLISPSGLVSDETSGDESTEHGRSLVDSEPGFHSYDDEDDGMDEEGLSTTEQSALEYSVDEEDAQNLANVNFATKTINALHQKLTDAHTEIEVLRKREETYRKREKKLLKSIKHGNAGNGAHNIELQRQLVLFQSKIEGMVDKEKYLHAKRRAEVLYDDAKRLSGENEQLRIASQDFEKQKLETEHLRAKLDLINEETASLQTSMLEIATIGEQTSVERDKARAQLKESMQIAKKTSIVLNGEREIHLQTLRQMEQISTRCQDLEEELKQAREQLAVQSATLQSTTEELRQQRNSVHRVQSEGKRLHAHQSDLAQQNRDLESRLKDLQHIRVLENEANAATIRRLVGQVKGKSTPLSRRSQSEETATGMRRALLASQKELGRLTERYQEMEKEYSRMQELEMVNEVLKEKCSVLEVENAVAVDYLVQVSQNPGQSHNASVLPLQDIHRHGNLPITYTPSKLTVDLVDAAVDQRQSIHLAHESESPTGRENVALDVSMASGFQSATSGGATPGSGFVSTPRSKMGLGELDNSARRPGSPGSSSVLIPRSMHIHRSGSVELDFDGCSIMTDLSASQADHQQHEMFDSTRAYRWEEVDCHFPLVDKYVNDLSLLFSLGGIDFPLHLMNKDAVMVFLRQNMVEPSPEGAGQDEPLNVYELNIPNQENEVLRPRLTLAVQAGRLVGARVGEEVNKGELNYTDLLDLLANWSIR